MEDLRQCLKTEDIVKSEEFKQIRISSPSVPEEVTIYEFKEGDKIEYEDGILRIKKL